MFNLKNIFSENSENKNSKNTSSSFLGDGKAILDAVDDGVLAVNSKGNILAINPAAEQITGWNGSDAAGLVFNSVLKITNNEGGEMIEISNPVNRVLRTGENFTTRDLFIKTQSGKIVPIFLAVNSIDSQNSGVVVVFRDISKELKENREQAEFISTASHEMRTPVASIEGYIGLALNPATATIDARAKSYLQKAHENTKHLGQLFQDLLDITKAEDGRLKNEPVVLDAIEFSRNIWEGLKPKAEAKGLNYIFEPDNHKTGEKTLTPVFFIHADRDHLHEILNNLFENAIKYTPSGMVSVNVMGDNNNVQISVKDSGIGIPAEDIPHLFQKFYRVDNSETREINGTGLGLFLSHKLTESIGGFLDVESEYKKGSTFTVKLPRITRENAEKLKAIEDTKKAEEYQKIEQKNNQREIDEADRDITAILEDPKIENPSEEVFEITQEIQPETSISIPETISQNTQPENSQVQQAPYTQNTTESTQQQEQQIYDNFVQNTAPIPQLNGVIAEQNQLAQKVTQTEQDFSKYGAIQGFSPLAGAQNQNGQNSVPNPQTVQNYNSQIAAENSQQNTQTIQNNYSPQSSIDIKNQQFQPPQMMETTQNTVPQPSQYPSNQPTLNDIERMKIEYAQKMMNQRKN